MDNVEQFDFLKNYYQILKAKNADDIGQRFLTQLKGLSAANEINRSVANIAIACIAIGHELDKDLTEEDIELIKSFIDIGLEGKEERTAFKLADVMKKSGKQPSAHASTSNYSGKSLGGC